MHRAWMHGLHPDALIALSKATDEELEIIAKLIRNEPKSAPDILRSFTYNAEKVVRETGKKFRAPTDVARRLTESLDLLKTAVKRGYPYGFRSSNHFQRFGLTVRDALRRYGVKAKDIFVHGSSLRKLKPDDIDIAVFVDRVEFDRLARQFVDHAKQNGKTILAKKIMKAASKGKIPYRMFGPREPGFVFGQVVREAAGESFKKVDLSLILRGSEFGTGPFVRL